ncbi:hypothetical protein DYBT9275_01126 [Dyadobacter sp. CECT 9275]|uniref:Uncharacterized protein n=1 Tax=Dyadobacter helix TaxID=2822344 RepID=A0A916J9J5_9BACT|nr:hypothetical protein [Dyadobacter sp. CECT 9275]CAG4993214.1 hypothetical protein DYBT9275_01126 [Dyadobacter sp. CECT 9275]
MRTKADIIQKYALFGSPLRGTEKVENALKQLLDEMQTPENIHKLGEAIGLEWNSSEDNVAALRKTFNRADRFEGSRLKKENIKPRKSSKVKVKASPAPEGNTVD